MIAAVDPAVAARFPTYRCLALVAEGLVGGPSDATSEALLAAAETADPVIDERITSWREAFRACGIKPKSSRPSHEALLLRHPAPRVNAIVDTYNAVSMTHRLPVGGEDLDAMVGTNRLVFATGDEPCEVPGGDGTAQPPKPGEPVWRDDTGVTCRRWCWRQGPRTAITTRTTRALFLLEDLGHADVEAAASALEAALTQRGARCERFPL